MTSKNLCRLVLAAAVLPFSVALALAVNVMPLKPDSANAAPMTVFGSPSNGVSVGKTTAPSGAMDIVGDLNVTGTVSGTVDTTKIPNNAIDTAKINAAAVTAAKIAPAAVDTSKIKKSSAGFGALCELNDGSGNFGHCSAASAAVCTCL